MEATFGPLVPDGGLIVDIGSADGPSVGWLDECARRVPVDIDAAAPSRGGACASALALPFADRALDVVSAFEVVEHFAQEARVLAELRRVLRPGGRLLVSVPAYAWAWSSHDVAAHHHRRYTRPRLVATLTAAGFAVERATYAFAATFPLFAADRLRERVFGVAVQRVSAEVSPVLARGCWRYPASTGLLRRGDVPFGCRCSRRPSGARSALKDALDRVVRWA